MINKYKSLGGTAATLFFQCGFYYFTPPDVVAVMFALCGRTYRKQGVYIK